MVEPTRCRRTTMVSGPALPTTLSTSLRSDALTSPAAPARGPHDQAQQGQPASRDEAVEHPVHEVLLRSLYGRRTVRNRRSRDLPPHRRGGHRFGRSADPRPRSTRVAVEAVEGRPATVESWLLIH